MSIRVTRSVEPEHNWFWRQGYDDAIGGLRAIVPDETRYSFQRSDYFAGYEAGEEDRDALLKDLSSASSVLVRWFLRRGSPATS